MSDFVLDKIEKVRRRIYFFIQKYIEVSGNNLGDDSFF